MLFPTYEYKASHGYRVRSCLKNNKNKNKYCVNLKVTILCFPCSLMVALLLLSSWLCLCQVLSPSSSSHCQFLSLRNQPKCHQVFPGTLCLINSEISVFSHQPETWQKAWDTLGAQDLIEGPQVHACPLSKQMMAWAHVCQRSIHLSVSRLKTLG